MTKRIAMSLSSRRVIVAALVVLLGCSLGCDRGDAPAVAEQQTSTRPSAQFLNYPAVANEFRFRWSAAPGIDVATGAAVAIRAYVESYRLVAFKMGDDSAAYPGFTQSTPENVPTTEKGDLIEHGYIRPTTRAEYEAIGMPIVERGVYGYQPTHILALEPRGNGYRATVCLGAYSVYVTADERKGQYVSTAANLRTGELTYDGYEIQIWRIELTEHDPRAGSERQPVNTPQAGPLPAPVDDVFGRWFITGQGTILWGPSGQGEFIDSPEVRQQCEQAMPDDAAARKAMATGFHAAPPPHGDPIPGWPQTSG